MTQDKNSYSYEYKIQAADSDMWRRLRISIMLRLFQDASIEHTEYLGYKGDEKK